MRLPSEEDVQLLTFELSRGRTVYIYPACEQQRPCAGGSDCVAARKSQYQMLYMGNAARPCPERHGACETHCIQLFPQSSKKVLRPFIRASSSRPRRP
jgi:hypothetical protein